MAEGHVRWGTSSWSEKSWVGPFYPAGTKPGDFLPFYANNHYAGHAPVTIRQLQALVED